MEDKVQEIAEKPEVSDSKKEKKSQATLWKEKNDARTAACFFAGCLHGSSATGLVFGLFAPSGSAPFGSARSALLVP